MITGKYVMTDRGPILFPMNTFQHDEFKELHPISAGLFYITENNQVKVNGESMTLNLKSDPDDAEKIKRWLVIG